MRWIALISLVAWSFNAAAQKVFTVDYASQADVKLFVVEYASQADLCVFKVDYASRAKGNEGQWFWVGTPLKRTRRSSSLITRRRRTSIFSSSNTPLGRNGAASRKST